MITKWRFWTWIYSSGIPEIWEIEYHTGEQRKEVSDKSFLVNLINYSKDIHISQFLSIGVGGWSSNHSVLIMVPWMWPLVWNFFFILGFHPKIWIMMCRTIHIHLIRIVQYINICGSLLFCLHYILILLLLITE